jgi:hypothetical protein
VTGRVNKFRAWLGSSREFLAVGNYSKREGGGRRRKEKERKNPGLINPCQEMFSSPINSHLSPRDNNSTYYASSLIFYFLLSTSPFLG